MDVSVRFPDDVLIISISCDDLTSDVKNTIISQKDISSTDCIELTYEGTVLDDDKNILSYGLTGNSELVVNISNKATAIAWLQQQGIQPKVEELLNAISNHHKDRHLTKMLIYAIPTEELNKTINGTNPVSLAAKCGLYWTVKHLIKSGVPVQENSEISPLYSAASQRDHIKLVNLLVDAGYNVNSVASPQGRTPLMTACRTERNLNTVKILLSNGSKIKMSSENGRTALMEAACKDADIAKYLLSPSYINDTLRIINHVDYDESTALTLSIRFLDLSVTKLLLENSASLNAGIGALLAAVRTGDIDKVKYILSRDAHVDPSALELSCHFNSSVILEHLLNHSDENVNKKLSCHSTILNSALTYSYLRTRRRLKTSCLEKVEMLLRHGADPNTSGIRGLLYFYYYEKGMLDSTRKNLL